MDKINKEDYNILYVDDEKSNLSSFRNLYRRKFNIFTASSGQEGLEILATQPIHAIITDQRMPNMKGIDFLIKVKDIWPGLKSILLTAYNDSEVIKDAINKTGIFWYVNKPFDPDQMEQIIINAANAYRAENKIKESESKYRDLVDNSLVGIFATSIDGRFSYVNEAMVLMYNFDSIEQMLAEGSLARWSNPKHREQMLVELKKHGSVTNFEAKTITNTGRHIHVIFSAKLQADRISGMVMDITYRKLMEEKLKINETNLVKAQEVAVIGSWSLDLLKNNLLWTNETYRIFDIPKGTPLSYEMFLEIVHPEDRDFVDKKWKNAMEGEPYDIEHRLLIDNKVKWIREKAELTFDKKGNPISGIGIAQDITKQKKAESEHEKLFNYSFDLLCIAGFDGYFKELNPSWEQITGYSLEELYTKAFTDFIHPDDLEKTATEIQKLSEGKASIDFENRYFAKNGKTIFLSWTVTPSLEENLMYCIARDITGRKIAEKRVLDYQDRLKDLANKLTISEEKIRKQIAVDLHDHVGQMLASIRMQLSRITDLEVNPELIIRIKNISQALLKAIQATRAAIFDLSPPQLNEIGLTAALHDWMKEQIDKKHHIKTIIKEESEEFLLDENTRYLLFRSIKELVINTVKHAKASQLSVELKIKGDDLEITYEDDGIGFNYNPDLLRLKSDSYGLFSIQERISDLGGSMKVDSVVDKGTKIKLVIPLKDN